MVTFYSLNNASIVLHRGHAKKKYLQWTLQLCWQKLNNTRSGSPPLLSTAEEVSWSSLGQPKTQVKFLKDLSFNKTNNLMYFYKRCNPQKLSLSNPKKTNTSDFLILEIRWIDKLILKIYLQFKKICLMVKFLIYWFLFLMWEEVKTSFPMFHMGITECCTCIGNVIVQT